MKKRIITGSLILIVEALFIISRLYTAYAFDMFVGLLAIVGSVEVCRVMERKRLFVNIPIVSCFTAVIYVALLLGIKQDRDWHFYLLYFIIAILALFVINFLIAVIFKGPTERERDRYGVRVSNAKYGLQRGMNSSFVMVYPAILFASMFVISHFFEFYFVNSWNFANTNLIVVFFLVLLFIVTIFTDTFALVFGMLIGGPKLCPRISPKKTISGAVGGFVFGTLGGLLTYFLFSFNKVFKEGISLFGIKWWNILIVSLICAIVCQVGDLIASALKRSARVKDYGTIFPGHGGVMDRVDGLICNSLVVAISMFIIM